MFNSLVSLFKNVFKTSKVMELEERILLLEEMVRLAYPNKKLDEIRRTRRTDRIKGTIH